MEFNTQVSMSNLDNIVAILEEGGMKTCRDIMNRSWELASDDQIASKIAAPRSQRNHTDEYAQTQLRGEIRRSLYDYFSDTESSYSIFRAKALRDPERFWVSEVQSQVEQEEEEVSLMEALSRQSVVVDLEDLSDEAVGTLDTLLEGLLK